MTARFEEMVGARRRRTLAAAPAMDLAKQADITAAGRAIRVNAVGRRHQPCKCSAALFRCTARAATSDVRLPSRGDGRNLKMKIAAHVLGGKE